jgi:uncharacterized BrkB/YihY/UPF0761 family membrane protein
VLLWTYFSAQFFLLGAEFTQIYSARFGRGRRAAHEPELPLPGSAPVRARRAT